MTGIVFLYTMLQFSTDLSLERMREKNLVGCHLTGTGVLNLHASIQSFNLSANRGIIICYQMNIFTYHRILSWQQTELSFSFQVVLLLPISFNFHTTLSLSRVSESVFVEFVVPVSFVSEHTNSTKVQIRN